MPLPNIVYLHSHDTGRYVQPYGYAVPTPNIQRLAEEGVLFRQAFCAAPTCSPSRAALLTGQAPHNNGMLGLNHRGFALRDYSQHIVHTLRKAGYFSLLTGFQHVARPPSITGYDEIRHGQDLVGDGAELRAADFIAHADRDTDNRPFFLDVGMHLTHRTGNTHFHHEGQRGDGRYACPPAGIPDTPVTRADFADFAVAAHEMDRRYGVVIDALRQHDLLDNTLIICTTDHGLPWPRAKSYLTDAGLGVLLVIRGPGGFMGGKVIEPMVSHLDLFPTLCDLANLPHPAWLQGKSLLPLLAGEQPLHEAIFAETTYHTSYEPVRAVRTDRWKYIKRFDPRRKITLPNTDASPTRQYLVDHGWLSHQHADDELYDLLFDPAESCNLLLQPPLASEAAAAALPDLRARLQQWMTQTADPLLDGPVHIKGAIVNDPDGVGGRDDPRTTLT